MSRLSSNLRNRVDVHTKARRKNELGEWEYFYSKLKTVNAQIIPTTSYMIKGQADTEKTESTHKIKVRVKSIPDLDNTYRFIYKNKTYEVKFFDVDFKNNEFYEVYTRLVQE